MGNIIYPLLYYQNESYTSNCINNKFENLKKNNTFFENKDNSQNNSYTKKNIVFLHL